MIRATVYRLTGDDGPNLTTRQIDIIYHLVAHHMLPEEKDGDSAKDRHPGVNAFRKLRGNAFGAEDVGMAEAYVKTLADRMRTQVDKLLVELNDIREKHMGEDLTQTIRAYKYLIDQVQATAAAAETAMENFSREFLEVAQAMRKEDAA